MRVMPNFKFIISSGKQSFQIEKDQKECPVIGKNIGESFSGDFLGLNGYELAITGGSDRNGFPMRKDVEGLVKKRVILERGIGFRGEPGLRRRKMIRGNTVGLDIIQINCKVVKQGEKPLEDLLGKKEEKKEEKQEATKDEAKKEEKVEPKQEETKKEEKPEEKENSSAQ